MRVIALVLVAACLTACRTRSVRRCCPAPAPVVQADAAPQPAPTWTPVRDAPGPSVASRVHDTRIAKLEFEEVSLTKCVQTLTAMTGIPVVVSPAVTKTAEDVEIGLVVDDVSMADVLDLITHPYDLRWAPMGDEVQIVKHVVDPSMKLRFYDVKDLASVHEKLEKAANEVVAPEEGASVTMQNGILIVRASQETLASIDRQLTELRRRMAR